MAKKKAEEKINIDLIKNSNEDVSYLRWEDIG